MPRIKALPIYSVMLYVGMVAALLVGDLLSRRAGLDPTRVLAGMLLLVPVMLGGARGLAVALNWKHYRSRPSEILRTDHGGAAMYGALPPAVLLSVPLVAWLDLPFGTFWDISAIAIVAGMIPTRLGCLGAGCCRGREVETRRWGVRRVPNPLFEAVLGVLLLIAMLLFWSRAPFPGATCLLAVASYGTGRFFLEWLREEREPLWWGLDALQWISLGLIATCLVGFTAAWFGTAEALQSVLAQSQDETAGFAPSAARLLLSALLLLPVVHLFRFLGCSFFLSQSEESPRQRVRLSVAVPDIGGTGPFRAEMVLEKEPDFNEIPESPVQLTDVGPDGDGRQAFDTLIEIDEADYRATCTVTRDGTAPRVGVCSGTLDSPLLVVRFTAVAGDPVFELTTQLCFEPGPA